MDVAESRCTLGLLGVLALLLIRGGNDGLMAFGTDDPAGGLADEDELEVLLPLVDVFLTCRALPLPTGCSGDVLET